MFAGLGLVASFGGASKQQRGRSPAVRDHDPVPIFAIYEPDSVAPELVLLGNRRPSSWRAVCSRTDR